jgi:anti-anti-sigma factor
MATGTARYAKDGDLWILQLAGEVRYPLAPAINALLDRAFSDPKLAHFLIDLSVAESIDSTNLGVLARVANHMSAHGRDHAVILAPNTDVLALLRVVCFDRLFHIVTTAGIDVGLLEPVDAPATDERAMLDLILDAHRRLCAINAQTRAVFENVVNLLEQERREKRGAQS